MACAGRSPCCGRRWRAEATPNNDPLRCRVGKLLRHPPLFYPTVAVWDRTAVGGARAYPLYGGGPRIDLSGGREWESNPPEAVEQPLPDLKSGRPTGDVSPPCQTGVRRTRKVIAPFIMASVSSSWPVFHGHGRDCPGRPLRHGRCVDGRDKPGHHAGCADGTDGADGADGAGPQRQEAMAMS